MSVVNQPEVYRAVLKDPAFRAKVAEASTPYGDGRTGARIAGLLAETPIDARLLHKRFVMGKDDA